MQRRGNRYRDTRTGRTLDTWFPKSGAPQARSCLALKYGLIEADQVEVEIASFEKGPTTSEEAYLCLHLLSERQTPPNSINLEHCATTRKKGSCNPLAAVKSAAILLPIALD